MSHAATFWTFFDCEAEPRLGIRAPTFRRIFQHLDACEHPVTVVETGCARSTDNWWGDGLSTVLFDRYVAARGDGSRCLSVDICAHAVENARRLVGPGVTVSQEDSVKFLARLAQRCEQDASSIDVLYLDSFDLDKLYWQPSAIHHLKELTAAMRCLRADTLVVVDDCPSIAECIPAREGDGLMVLNPPAVGGKGLLVAQYAQAVGARLEFAEYQAGWTGMVPSQLWREHDAQSRQSPTRASIAAQ